MRVPPRGDAPRSSGYQPDALLLSYGGENGNPLGGAPEICTLDAIHDGAAAFRAASSSRPDVLPGGDFGGAPGNRTLDAIFSGAAVFKTVSSSVPDVLLLKKSARTRSRTWNRACKKQGMQESVTPCGLWKNGGRDGCHPRCLLPDKEASLLFLFTTKLWVNGCGVTVMLRAGLGGACSTDRLASLTNYRRVFEMDPGAGVALAMAGQNTGSPWIC